MSDDYLPPWAVAAAQQLAGAVHEHGPAEVAAILEPLDRQQLFELAVTLGAMVDPSLRPSELLAWNDDPQMSREQIVAVDHQFRVPVEVTARRLGVHPNTVTNMRRRLRLTQPRKAPVPA